MSLRIAHVTATFPPYRGGTGNVCAQNVRELARRGHDVHVFTAAMADAPVCEQYTGATIHRLRPLLRLGNAPLLPGLLPALRGFDIVHLHYPFFGGELTALAAWLCRTPLVITYHQDVLLEGMQRGIEWGLRHTTSRMTLRTATAVLFTSLDYAQASYARLLLRGREHTIGELPNGVDLAVFTPSPPPDSLRTKHQLAPEDQVVLLVAGLDRAHFFKGVNIFLQALTALPNHVKAVIVGDGDLREAYAITAQRLGIAQRVQFAGRVSEADLPDYYRLADITVLPSTTMGEAFGLVLVESLASGTPAVATNLPGVRTVIEHGGDGLLVAPGDSVELATALQHLLNDQTARCTMGKQGRARVEVRYGWQQIGARLEAVYWEQIAAGIKRRATSQ